MDVPEKGNGISVEGLVIGGKALHGGWKDENPKPNVTVQNLYPSISNCQLELHGDMGRRLNIAVSAQGELKVQYFETPTVGASA